MAAAVADGRLERKPCVICDEPTSFAHHANGYEPEHRLDIIWLCRLHHSLVHGRGRPTSVPWSQVKRSKFPLGVPVGLHELRVMRLVSQVEVARRLGKAQPAISAIEHRQDVFLSTLREYVQALGGELEVSAVFDGQRVPLAIGSAAHSAIPSGDAGTPSTR